MIEIAAVYSGAILTQPGLTLSSACRYLDKETNAVIAMKRIKLEPSMFRREGFPMTSVREINILLTMDHPNIVNVSEVVTSKNKSGLMDVYMVMEYVQLDLKKFLDTYKAKLKVGEVRDFSSDSNTHVTNTHIHHQRLLRIQLASTS